MQLPAGETLEHWDTGRRNPPPPLSHSPQGSPPTKPRYFLWRPPPDAASGCSAAVSALSRCSLLAHPAVGSVKGPPGRIGSKKVAADALRLAQPHAPRLRCVQTAAAVGLTRAVRSPFALLPRRSESALSSCWPWSLPGPHSRRTARWHEPLASDTRASP